MKKFKEFIKGKPVKTKEPTLITAQPVHGEHAKPKKVEEAFGQHGPYHGDSDRHWSEAGENENHHLGKDIDAVHKKLNMTKKEFQSHPGHEHVKEYSDYSETLNSDLIHKATHKKMRFEAHPDDKPHDKQWKTEQSKEHHAAVEGIDKAIAHKPLKHDVHVYHGTHKWHPGEEAAKSKENKVKIPSYLSTSVERSKAHAFAGSGKGSHILHIHLKKGQKGMYVGGHSEYAHEREMLLPRDTTLKIHPKPHVTKEGTHIWHAHVTDD